MLPEANSRGSYLILILSRSGVSRNSKQVSTSIFVAMPLDQFEPRRGSLYRPLSYVRRACVAASYPIRGIWYFLRNKEFWPLFWGRLLPISLISFLVYFVLFTFTFLPQYAFLAIFHGAGAWVNAVVLVLGEGLVIIQGLFEGFFVDESRVDVYDVSPVPRISLQNHSTRSDELCKIGHADQAVLD